MSNFLDITPCNTRGNSCENFPGVVKVETTSKTNLAVNHTLRAVNRILDPVSKVLQFSFLKRERQSTFQLGFPYQKKHHKSKK